MALAAAMTASGEEFPLTYRTIPAEDVMSFLGGSGSYGQLGLTRPTKLKKEPKAVSRHPLYGECRDTSTGAALVFRLDESKGDGRGYDQLIVDMNQNGDLTDDPVALSATPAHERGATSPDQLRFGPIQAPADKAVAGGRPIYYAQVYVFNRQLLSSGQKAPNLFFGQLVLKAGWYLDTTVELNGLKQKVGVFDGNSNLRLGDVAQPETATSRGEKSWYFRPADYLLVDADGSGSFEHDVFQSEACPFGPILYLGTKAYKVALAPDCKSLRVEPWTEPLAEVALHPQGDQVRNITLAWEGPNGRWQLFRRRDRRQGDGAARELPVIRLQPVGPRRPERPSNGVRHATYPADAREHRRRQSQYVGLRRALADQGHGRQDRGRNAWAARRGFRRSRYGFGVHAAH